MKRFGHYRTYSDMWDEFTDRFGEQSDGEYVLLSDVEPVISKLKEYLAFDSCDGRKERIPLRKELKEMVEKL